MATTTPYKQIRALYDDEIITVYQAYNTQIASAAVAAQKLDASTKFRIGSRMTWVKPSWAWMLYRAGYSYKDPGQERILAIKMRHADFVGLLARGVLTPHATGKTSTSDPDNDQGSADKQKDKREKSSDVKIQWDPERTVRLEKLEYRSIQIGIPGALTPRWAEEMIVGIEDVTDKARELKRVLDERPGVTDEELVDMELVPVERPFEISEELQKSLRMVLPEE
ncbi:hypothetical protein B0H66DRAFT_256764 [Apodospora peruviana]|uniref:ATP-dependent RNA helicase DHX8 n=1 Tax=Apodospora peruviana TaxID=516989 RepID=A0AAE0I5Y9_9PEZI|nr:hypothetical protein B0H66DRAFT_256764 [Apodospora peruviana]